MRNGYRYYIESPMQKCFRRLNTKIALFLLLLTIIVLSVPSSVSAVLPQHVYVLIAYDEEWVSLAEWPYYYTPETLAHIFFEVVSWRFLLFDIQFIIAGYTSWDSDDGISHPVLRLNEAIEETGFESDLTTVNGYRCDILVAFTDQYIYNSVGVYNATLGAVLVKHFTTFHGGNHIDNIQQHEISHLYGCEHHDEHGLDCVMNTHLTWLPFPDCGWTSEGQLTDNWCDSCVETIMSNREEWGHTFRGGGLGGGGPYETIPEKGDFDF